MIDEDDLIRLAERLWAAGPRSPLDPDDTWSRVPPHVRKMWMRVAVEAVNWSDSRQVTS